MTVPDPPEEISYEEESLELLPALEGARDALADSEHSPSSPKSNMRSPA